MAAMPRSPRIIVTLSNSLLDRITALAKRHGLSRAAYIRLVLSQHVEKEGGDRK
jgi:predicted DNA binding CopG/RHH family protein